MLIDILNKLYSNSSQDVFSILNSSIFITEMKNKNDAILFHTGFRFQTHKASLVDIYYDLYSKQIIRYSHNPSKTHERPPHLIGSLCKVGDSGYIENCYKWLITSISVKDLNNKNDDNILKGLLGNNILDLDSLTFVLGEIKEVPVMDDDGNLETHKVFKLFDVNDVKELPLQKNFAGIVFFNGFKFNEYSP